MAQNFTNTLPKSNSSLTGDVIPKRVTGSPTGSPYQPLTLNQPKVPLIGAAIKSKTAGSTSPTAITSALNSKINPNPVAPLIQKTATTSAPAPQQTYQSTGVNAGINPYTLKPYNAPAPVAQPVQAQAPASQPVAPTYAPYAPYEQPAVQAETPESKPGLYRQLIDRAVSLSEEAKAAQEASRLFSQKKGQAVNDVLNDPNKSLDTGIGRAGQIQANLGLQETALATQAEQAVANANTAMGIAGLAAPQGVGQGEIKFDPTTGQMITSGGVQVPYSNQYLNTATGQPMGGGMAGGSLDSAVSTVAQRVKSGAMSYDQGVQALAGYGQGGLNALTQALGPDFNISQSNATASAREADILQTGTTGGQISKAATSALGALDALTAAYGQLGITTGASNIPILNQIAQSVAMNTGLGRERVSAYQGALKEARAQINAVLAPVVGVESANATSNSLLPDNMLPAELPQKILAAKEYINQRVASYTQPSTPLNVGGTSAGGSVVQTVAGPINVNW